MAKIQRSGDIQLKPIASRTWEKNDNQYGIIFDFEDQHGDTIDGHIGWTKSDGSANDSIEAFGAALEGGKSLLCFVDESEYNGRPQFRVKWPAAKKEGRVLAVADLKAAIAEARKAKPAAAPADSDTDIHF